VWLPASLWDKAEHPETFVLVHLPSDCPQAGMHRIAWLGHGKEEPPSWNADCRW
jgi:hypothetical protein